MDKSYDKRNVIKTLEAMITCNKKQAEGYPECVKDCDDCSLLYEQGNFEERIEVLEMAIKALEQEPCEDAISREWLKIAIHNFYHGLKHTPTEEDIQAYIDAAPPVNPQPCEDAISRENAIIRISWDFPTLEISKVKESLDKLPSVTPQPKTGHWIRHDNGKYHWYLCSCCDAMVGSDEKMMAYKYCPNCGAKMVEPQESEAQE